MRINHLFIESAAKSADSARHILAHLQPEELTEISDFQDLFSRRKTEYLTKRLRRNAYIAVKRGAMVKKAPPAYGFGAKDEHYYYVHAYNCVYECEYCYLQGYFSSPDLVFFVNHSDALVEMEQLHSDTPAGRNIWFHAGEFSDSLALSHITGEIPLYWPFFENRANAFLELRTKSTNLTVLRNLQPLPNVIVSFSLSTPEQAARFDREAPPVHLRIAAMQRLANLGFRLGVHFDPLVYDEEFAAAFSMVLSDLANRVGFAAIDYVSVGAVRFAKDVYREARINYPDSGLFARNFIQGHDNKMRYVRPLRLHLIEQAISLLKKHGCPEEKIYTCME